MPKKNYFNHVNPKFDLPEIERKILDYWNREGIVKKYLQKNSSSDNRFSFLDGPITANGPMGVHHALGRTYKDLWQRFFNMKSYAQRFQNGFDEQGLWVEVEVERELGLKTKKDIENLVPGKVFESIAKFVNLCKERVKKYASVQTEQSKRLGYFMDWENSYHTSSDHNNYAIWHYLKTIHEKGWLYKGRDTVPWCPRCGTAISQHEILTEEYQEITHKSVFLKYPIVGRNNEFLLVWTTTPWTLPGNSAVAVNPDLEYQATEIDGELVWYAKDASERLKKLLLGAGQPEKVGKSKLIRRLGKDMAGWKYEGPFDQLDRVKKEAGNGNFHRVVGSDELVTAEEGTGLVHIAPGAGAEDFKLGKEQDTPTIELIDEEATYIEGLGEFTGKNAKEHPELIIDYLKTHEDGKYFMMVENYSHRYPVCWRCKTELVWRVVDEWYIAMDRKDPEKGKTYREMMKEVIKDINWVPRWGYDRELDWLNNMADWLISKKRYWGLALPIWECRKCGNFDVVGSKEELKERSIEGWEKFDGSSPHRPWVDQVKIKCSKCGENSQRIADVGSPWLDAGIVPFSTYLDPQSKKVSFLTGETYWQEWFPADFVTESFPGQFKNWFYAMIAMSTGLVDKAPFKNLLGYGLVKDEKGEEMHKSKGNAIEFNEAAEKIGVDVMRWIYVTQNPEYNLNFGYHLADEVRKRFLLIWWNVYNFFVTYANVDSWVLDDKFDPADLTNVLDRWVVSRMEGLIKKVSDRLEKYDPTVSREIESFIINDLSTWYIRRIRERVGPTVVESEDRDVAYRTIHYCLTTLCKLTAPFLPFISEEIYQNLTREESVHLVSFPASKEKFINKKLELDMEQVRQVVEAGHSLRKEKGIKVRQPLAKLSYGKKINKMSGDLE
ncbi:MAG: isoleucine--tRNA ligase, partial [Candidatus Woykebacteria bacterium RBG_13_40_7b]